MFGSDGGFVQQRKTGTLVDFDLVDLAECNDVKRENDGSLPSRHRSARQTSQAGASRASRRRS